MAKSFLEQLQSTGLNCDEVEKMQKRLEELLLSQEMIDIWAISTVSRYKDILLKKARSGEFRLDHGKKIVEAKCYTDIPTLPTEAMEIATKLYANHSLDFSYFDVFFWSGGYITRACMSALFGVKCTGRDIFVPRTVYGKKFFWSKPGHYIEKRREKEFGFGHFSTIYIKRLKEEAEREGIIISEICAYESDSDGNWTSPPIVRYDFKSKRYDHYCCSVSISVTY